MPQINPKWDPASIQQMIPSESTHCQCHTHRDVNTLLRDWLIFLVNISAASSPSSHSHKMSWESASVFIGLLSHITVMQKLFQKQKAKYMTQDREVERGGCVTLNRTDRGLQGGCLKPTGSTLQPRLNPPLAREANAANRESRAADKCQHLGWRQRCSQLCPLSCVLSARAVLECTGQAASRKASLAG